MSDNNAQFIREAACLLREARQIACLTGAGASAESGIPTFRGAGGLWESVANPEELVSIEGWHRDPLKVWKFHMWLRDLVRQSTPNPGHYALAQMQEILPSFTLITQNIDGLDRQAGLEEVLMIHGDLWANRCLECGCEALDPQTPAPGDVQREATTPDRSFTSPEEIEASDVIPPDCTRCSGKTRPGVVWFGEMLPEVAFSKSAEAAERCDVMLVIGTSAVVQPAASLAYLAVQRGATIIEINLEPALAANQNYLAIPGKAGEVLPEIVSLLRA